MAVDVEGTLSDYWEQGWEGHFELVLQEDGVPGMEGMRALAPGDHLTVWDAAGRELMSGPLPRWTARRVLGLFRVEPTLPDGFFDWFRVHHHRARLRRAAR
jgi:hypothetical protein